MSGLRDLLNLIRGGQTTNASTSVASVAIVASVATPRIQLPNIILTRPRQIKPLPPTSDELPRQPKLPRVRRKAILLSLKGQSSNLFITVNTKGENKLIKIEDKKIFNEYINKLSGNQNVSYVTRITEFCDNVLSPEYALNSIRIKKILYIVVPETVQDFSDLATDFQTNLLGIATIIEDIKLEKKLTITDNVLNIKGLGIFQTMKQPDVSWSNYLNNKVIEIDVLLSKGVGGFIIDYLKEQSNIFLKSLPSAYYFYILKKFIPYYNYNNEWITVPHMFLKDQYYYYNNISNEIIKKLKGLTKNDKKYVNYTKYFKDLIPLVWFKNKVQPVVLTAGSNKIKYKSYHYKVRKDRYGSYILTKKDGRVSLKKALKSC
jgi:hypothetical protein